MMHDWCRTREGWGMSGEDNKHVVAEFVERCQNQHDLDFADEAFHPKFANHYRPEGQALPETSPCSTVPAAPSGVRPPPSGACSRSESRSGPAFTPARSRWSATGSGASLSTSV